MQNLRELISKALDEMKLQGASAKQLHIYRTTSFGNILRYFNQKMITDINADMLDDYLSEMYTDYLAGNYSYWKWGAVRRGKELLVHFMCYGSINLDRLCPWDYTHGMPRQSVIYDTPSKSQLNEPMNLFVIVWKIRKLLTEAGYTESSLKHYTSEGLTVILRRHYEAGIKIYSESLTNEIVCAKRADFENGITSRQSYQNLRKAAIFISSFVKTGRVDFSNAPMWNIRVLSSHFDEALNGYINHLLNEHRLKDSSVFVIRSALRNFLFGLEEMGIYRLKKLNQLTVNQCITRTAPRYSCGARILLYASRLFLNYLYEEKITTINLSNAVSKTFAVKKTFHEPFSSEELQLLLSAPDRSTAIGSRNYAIMLLACKTGLRACDIVNLKREDIDWHCNRINIVQQKTGVAISLPLPIEAGNAIAEYILKYRPKSSLPYIFLCKSRNVKPINNRSASNMVTNYMKLTGIHDPLKRRGFHSLRRSFGTSLLNNEIPMDLIQQLLGHTQMNSMKPYLSVNEMGLKQCALSLTFEAGKEASI